MRFALRRVGPSSCSLLNVNHLACDHLEMGSLTAMPMAHIVAVKPDHDRADWLCRVGGILLRCTLGRLLFAYAVLVVADRDFGELIFHQGLTHAGIIFFRLPGAPLQIKIDQLNAVLEKHADELSRGKFLVASPRPDPGCQPSSF